MMVVVTGTAGSLGTAVARHFCDAGHTVVGLDRAYAHVSLLPHPEIVGLHTRHLDVTDRNAIREVLGSIATDGPIEGFVHCAGGYRYGAIHEVSDADADFLVEVNLLSSIHLVRELVGQMRTTGRGRIVLVSARSSQSPAPNQAIYAVTKGALNVLVQSVAAEVAGQDITVNAVLPSIIDTPANRSAMPDADPAKWVPPASLAALVHGFFEPAGAHLNGTLLQVAGRL